MLPSTAGKERKDPGQEAELRDVIFGAEASDCDGISRVVGFEAFIGRDGDMEGLVEEDCSCSPGDGTVTLEAHVQVQEFYESPASLR